MPSRPLDLSLWSMALAYNLDWTNNCYRMDSPPDGLVTLTCSLPYTP